MALFSKFQTLPVTCHEYVHPWTKSCSGATAGLGLTSVQESFRIYLTVYMDPVFSHPTYYTAEFIVSKFAQGDLLRMEDPSRLLQLFN